MHTPQQLLCLVLVLKVNKNLKPFSKSPTPQQKQLHPLDSGKQTRDDLQEEKNSSGN